MMLRIDIVDMRLRDERALKVLQETMNPETRRSRLSINDLAEVLMCHRNTASKIVQRLQGAGYVRKDLSRSHRYLQIEVLPDGSTPRSGR